MHRYDVNQFDRRGGQGSYQFLPARDDDLLSLGGVLASSIDSQQLFTRTSWPQFQFTVASHQARSAALDMIRRPKPKHQPRQFRSKNAIVHASILTEVRRVRLDAPTST